MNYSHSIWLTNPLQAKFSIKAFQAVLVEQTRYYEKQFSLFTILYQARLEACIRLCSFFCNFFFQTKELLYPIFPDQKTQIQTLVKRICFPNLIWIYSK